MILEIKPQRQIRNLFPCKGQLISDFGNNFIEYSITKKLKLSSKKNCKMNEVVESVHFITGSTLEIEIVEIHHKSGLIITIDQLDLQLNTRKSKLLQILKNLWEYQ